MFLPLESNFEQTYQVFGQAHRWLPGVLLQVLFPAQTYRYFAD